MQANLLLNDMQDILAQVFTDVMQRRSLLLETLRELLPLNSTWGHYRSTEKLYEQNDVRTQYITGLIKSVNNYAVSLCSLLQRSEGSPLSDFLINLSGSPEDVQANLLYEYRTYCQWGYLINTWTVTEEAIRLIAPHIVSTNGKKIWLIIRDVLRETCVIDQEELFTVIRARRNLQHTNAVHTDRHIVGSVEWDDSKGKHWRFVLEFGACFDHTQITNEFLLHIANGIGGRFCQNV